MNFDPIAIVGNACLFPGARNPTELWDLALHGKDVLSKVPEGYWRIPPEQVLAASPHDAQDKTWCARGGYVEGFESVFDPEGFSISADDIRGYDPLVQWVLHTGREALKQAEYSGEKSLKIGAIFGNLSYPSHSLNHFAETIWLGSQDPVLMDGAGLSRPKAVNRFMSGLPAHILARALDLNAGAFAIDAACASSLYAVKLACDQLHDGKADLMLAGGVNRGDDLILHIGFCALQAMSRSGQSRPYHRNADGLVPSQGAGFVALKRLDDAIRADDRILGVIRGIGLSNDGSSQGLLVPSVEGQVRAIRQAYEMSGLTPADISLVEGHATGTSTGDRVEILSMGRVFQGDCRNPVGRNPVGRIPVGRIPMGRIPMGSIKSNMGHSITASGMAGLIKILGAMEAGVRPPTLHVEEPMAELDESPFRLITQPEAWDAPSPRRAAINNFGFGGNNAHMIVEAYEPAAVHKRAAPNAAPPTDIAVVGLGAVVAKAAGKVDFAQSIFSGTSLLSRQSDGKFSGMAEPFDLPLLGLGFSPTDLDQTLSQQLLLLKAALEATSDAGPLPEDRTAVMVGMGCDAEAARSGMCWRLPWLVRRHIRHVNGDSMEKWIANARNRIHPIRQAGAIIGAMPNITANRINSQFDMAGPSLTVSAEELSGMRCLDLAIRGLRAHEIDAALVGAVDLCCEPVHEAAAASVLDKNRQIPGDAAVMLILKRVEDARKDGNKIYALFSDETKRSKPTLRLGLAADHLSLVPLIGHAHAASGLVHVAAAALACHNKTLPATHSGPGRPWQDSEGPRSAVVSVQALGGESASIRLVEDMESHTAVERSNPYPQTHDGNRTYAAHPPKIELPPIPRAALTTASQDPILDAMAQHHATLSSAHAHYLERKAKTYQHFLENRRQALKIFMEAATTAIRPSPEGGAGRNQPPSFKHDTESLPRTSENHPLGDHDPGLPQQKSVSPAFSYDQLRVFASGKISDVFGPLFKTQDNFHRQVRLPEPPLLLAHRVTGIDAEPGAMGKGVIWTETDVDGNAWYAHNGYMSPGMTVEAGQCDLLLISWLGIDFLNQGQRVYRLLGCDLVYHGSPAKDGDTLCYEIHVDGHSRAGGVRIFFFHYHCTINGKRCLSVRNARAGFFTDQELAESKGVMWSPETAIPAADARVDPPAMRCTSNAFSEEQITAFSQGRVHDCFGPGFEITRTHTRTPTIPTGRMCLLDQVTSFDPTGGPWKRGYLRVENRIPPDAWYLTCHFKNDPCMPGTLMSDACLQAMAVYLTAMGYTLNRDGWRFEPVPDRTVHIKCRGQVTPSSEKLSYEVFVEEVIAGPHPTLYADLLGVCDGLKILHIRRMGLRLVPDWPLDTQPEHLLNYVEKKTVARASGMTFGYKSMLACALGRPSDAFGELGRPFDNGRHIARLPAPPYHFITRVSRLEARMQAMESGSSVEIEYDIPSDAWYFDANGYRTMPFAILMEAGLQPCGWLAIFEGVLSTSQEDLYFRNLDGKGVFKGEIWPDSGILTTRTTLTKITCISGVALVNFEVVCSVEENVVYKMTTGFGFFLKKALAQQVGLPATQADIAWLDEPNDFWADLTQAPEKYFNRAPRLPKPKLLMVDRVTGYWPGTQGQASARLRAEKRVDIDEWFFKAHFFQDPVQPGSLGVESMVQLLQFYMLHENMQKDILRPRFLPFSIDASVTWKYRGQVSPDKKRITIEMTILDQGKDAQGAYATAEAWLWADELRIFHVKGLKVHIVEDKIDATDGDDTAPGHSDRNVETLQQTVARKLQVPPATVQVREPEQSAVCKAKPLNIFPFSWIDQDIDGGRRITMETSRLDYNTIFAHTRVQLGIKSWFGEDYFKGLSSLFIRHLILEDPGAFEKVAGRSSLFIGNHQVQIESILFPVLAQVLNGRPILAIADADHRSDWVGALDSLISTYPGIAPESKVVYFDQDDRRSMFDILERLRKEISENNASVFLHAEGKLGLTCRHPVQNLSSVFVDLALDSNLPVVPVRFSGGLPIAKMETTLNFPVGYGKQDYHIGRPILPDELRALPYAERRKKIMDRINDLGPATGKACPNPPNPVFNQKVAAWKNQTGVSEEQAVLFKALEMIEEPTRDTRALIQVAKGDFTPIENDKNAGWLHRMADWMFGRRPVLWRA